MAFVRVQTRLKKKSQALRILKVPLKMKRIITGREKILRHFYIKQCDEVH